MKLPVYKLWIWGVVFVLGITGCTTGVQGASQASSTQIPSTSSPSGGVEALGAETSTEVAALQETATPSPLPPSPTSPPTLTPTPTAVPPVRFAVIGDYGDAKNPGLAEVANLVKSWNPDFILTVGDNNYPSGEAATIDDNIGQFFHEYIYNYQGDYGEGSDTLRYLPTLGNHDWDTRKGKAYFDYFTLPGNERYYTYTLGTVEIFAIDSDSREPDGVGRSSVQGQWLKSALEKSTTPWQIVAFHHAPYTSGAVHGPVDWMRWPFEEWGADAVLTGHEHSYERLQVKEIPYFVNGLGGGAIYDFDKPTRDSVIRYNGGYAAMLVEADSDSLFFQAINVDGVVVDSYTVQK